jgi:putative phage-type endonuclease
MTVEIVCDLGDLGSGDPRWHELRRQGVGGSDAPVIAGLSPWKSPYELWLEKVTANEEQRDQEYLAMGHLLEGPVAEEFGRRTGHEVHTAPVLLRSVEHPFMQANVDRLVGPLEALLGGLEVKTTSRGTDWEVDGAVVVPLRVQAQNLHYMTVTGYRRWWTAVLIGGQGGFRIHVVESEWTQRAADTLIELEADFWDKVQRNVAPSTDGSESTRRALQKRWDAEPGKVAEVTGDRVRDLIARRRNVKGIASAAADDVADIDAQLMSLLGDAEVATVDGHHPFSWRAGSRTSLDTKALAAAHPDIAAQFQKTSHFRTLRVSDKEF